MEEDEVNFVINEFLGNLGSLENDVGPAKAKRIRHVHWWDGWEDKPEAEPEEDFRALRSELYAILERTGGVQRKKNAMKELRKRAKTDKSGKSVKDLVMVYYQMDFFTSGFSLDNPNNFASKIHRMLQLDSEEALVLGERKSMRDFVVEENERADDKLVAEEVERVEEVEVKPVREGEIPPAEVMPALEEAVITKEVYLWGVPFLPSKGDEQARSLHTPRIDSQSKTLHAVTSSMSIEGMNRSSNDDLFPGRGAINDSVQVPSKQNCLTNLRDVHPTQATLVGYDMHVEKEPSLPLAEDGRGFSHDFCSPRDMSATSSQSADLSRQTPALDATQAQSEINVHTQGCIEHLQPQALRQITKDGDSRRSKDMALGDSRRSNMSSAFGIQTTFGERDNVSAEEVEGDVGFARENDVGVTKNLKLAVALTFYFLQNFLSLQLVTPKCDDGVTVEEDAAAASRRGDFVTAPQTENGAAEEDGKRLHVQEISKAPTPTVDGQVKDSFKCDASLGAHNSPVCATQTTISGGQSQKLLSQEGLETEMSLESGLLLLTERLLSLPLVEQETLWEYFKWYGEVADAVIIQIAEVPHIAGSCNYTIGEEEPSVLKRMERKLISAVAGDGEQHGISEIHCDVDSVHTNKLFGYLCNEGKLDEANRFFQGMVDGGQNPNVETYDILKEKFSREDNFDSDLMWRRLIRSVLEQSLAKLRSSRGLVAL